jgi:hypothetical protein
MAVPQNAIQPHIFASKAIPKRLLFMTSPPREKDISFPLILKGFF